MTSQRARRTQAERDAVTVEIGYALFSAAFAAAVLFGAVAGPAYVFDLPAGVRGALVGAGATVASVVFAVRVVSVLVRFRHAGRPSRPGRPSPDS